MLGNLTLLATVLILVVSFLRLLPLWREKSWQRGSVYNQRSIARMWTVTMWMDVAVVAVNLVAVLSGYWSSLIGVVICAGLAEWARRRRKSALDLARRFEELEVSEVVIPDHPEDFG